MLYEAGISIEVQIKLARKLFIEFDVPRQAVEYAKHALLNGLEFDTEQMWAAARLASMELGRCEYEIQYVAVGHPTEVYTNRTFIDRVCHEDAQILATSPNPVAIYDQLASMKIDHFTAVSINAVFVSNDPSKVQPLTARDVINQSVIVDFEEPRGLLKNRYVLLKLKGLPHPDEMRDMKFQAIKNRIDDIKDRRLMSSWKNKRPTNAFQPLAPVPAE